MNNKELIEKVLGRTSDYYTDNYVEYGFPKQYKLIEKIYNSLGEEEFSELYNMMNENHIDFFRIVNYFEYEKESN